MVRYGARWLQITGSRHTAHTYGFFWATAFTCDISPSVCSQVTLKAAPVGDGCRVQRKVNRGLSLKGLFWRWFPSAGGGWAANWAQLLVEFLLCQTVLEEGDEKWGKLHQLLSLVKIISKTTAGKWVGRRRKTAAKAWTDRTQLELEKEGELDKMPL